ncbi:MAG: hypothetical protein IIX36_06810 [Clostridia bacterium]|nr:hypothetical protein [Clostridia bacterium]
MNKNFTPEDIKKKHETNVKSATSGFVLAGILGIIYIVRFFITKNFDFYFSLTFTELFLRLSDFGETPDAFSYVLIADYMAIYFVVAFLAARNRKRLSLALGLYIFDCLCFIPLFIFHGSIQPEYFIDVIVHIFVIIFLSVGISSSRRLTR